MLSAGFWWIGYGVDCGCLLLCGKFCVWWLLVLCCAWWLCVVGGVLRLLHLICYCGLVMLFCVCLVSLGGFIVACWFLF